MLRATHFNLVYARTGVRHVTLTAQSAFNITSGGMVPQSVADMVVTSDGMVPQSVADMVD